MHDCREHLLRLLAHLDFQRARQQRRVASASGSGARGNSHRCCAVRPDAAGRSAARWPCVGIEAERTC